jgi:thiamine-monophosphate kinase
MMDISDGLLIDTERMATASDCQIALMLEAVPLSAALLAVRPDVLDTRLAAATAGDDYQLLFAADPGQAEAIRSLAATEGVAVTAIGHAAVGAGLLLPERLGFAH